MAILIDNDLIRFESIEDSKIIIGTIKEELVVTLDVAKKIKEYRLSIWGSTTKPLITNVSGLQSIDDDARDYWATPESMQYLSSVAIVTNKKFQVLLVNFFILFSKPAVPTRLFSNYEEAFKWSKKFC